ncbi:MAG: hypothetical protein LBQ08_03435 [Holosporaceae bacterium]|jgi:hypothetical protein|nr:hypothetical protein [Holosporaceae bacterium]
MNKVERNVRLKMKPGTAVLIIVSVMVGFILSRLTTSLPGRLESAKLSENNSVDVSPTIEKLLKTHKLLQRCKSDTRELDFLKEGGEYFADYKNPRTLNDKIGYILQNYFQKSPVTSHIGNKYLAKKYIAQRVGKDHVVKLLAVWDNPSDIEWNILPDRFVLKTVRGHFGKQVIPVKDKSKINVAAILQQLEEFCETPGMKRITEKRIMAEEYLEPTDGTKAVTDYKFFCSFGKVFFAYCLAVDDGDTCDMYRKSFSFYSVPAWKRLPITLANHDENLIPRPKHLSQMITLAEKLSKPFPLIRIDLYEVGDRVLVGEITEDSGGAKYIFSPVIWDFKLGEMINVPTLEELEKIIENDKKEYGEEEIATSTDASTPESYICLQKV